MLRIDSRILVVAAVLVGLAFLGFLAWPQQTSASPEEGRAAFQKGLCFNCHGANGEGGFGPTLAGRVIAPERVLNQLRNPFRRMPSYRTDQISDAEAASIPEFLATLPAPAERGQPRFVAGETDSPVKQEWIERGCAQCHGAAQIGFMPLWAERGPLSLPALLERKSNGGRAMPAFRQDQVSDALETQFHGFLMNMLANNVPVSAGITASRSGSQTTFTIMVHNNGMEEASVEVKGVLPAGARLIDSWAGSGRGFNAGKFDGTAVGWINTSVMPGRDQGPFVFLVDTGNDPASAYTWVSHVTAGGHAGAYTSRPATATP